MKGTSPMPPISRTGATTRRRHPNIAPPSTPVRPRRRGALRVPRQHGAQSRPQESKGAIAAARVEPARAHTRRMIDFLSRAHVPPMLRGWWGRGQLGPTVKSAFSALLAYKVRALLCTIGVTIGSASIVLVVTAGLTRGRRVIAQIE